MSQFSALCQRRQKGTNVQLYCNVNRSYVHTTLEFLVCAYASVLYNTKRQYVIHIDYKGSVLSFSSPNYCCNLTSNILKQCNIQYYEKFYVLTSV